MSAKLVPMSRDTLSDDERFRQRFRPFRAPSFKYGDVGVRRIETRTNPRIESVSASKFHSRSTTLETSLLIS
jgi:hypothetical protein